MAQVEERMKHLDLFSGIGGFALAAQQVWEDYETVAFCDNDRFCQQVLRKRFPNVPIYGDIRTLSRERFIADTHSNGQSGNEAINADQGRQQTQRNPEASRRLASNAECNGLHAEHYTSRKVICEGQLHTKENTNGRCGFKFGATDSIDLITGGFPCQPFSHAGKRKGTDDNRYLWPEMLRVISDFKPTWVIAENVRGILTINDGMVFEQVCLDLEGEGYEVQPIIIPACAVNAPHRRDRVWFVANKNNDTDPASEGWTRCRSKDEGRLGQPHRHGSDQRRSWQKNWPEVAGRLCRMDDGLPAQMDGLELSKSRHRVERLKSLGNSIVPQVAVEIMKAIKLTESK